MPILHVALAERSYPLVIAPGLLAQADAWLAESGLGPRFAVITNPVVDALHGARLRQSLARAGGEIEMIIVPDGERHKNLPVFNRIIGEMLRRRCDRDTAVVAFGGGVIGDLAGYVAAAYMRGLPLVQIPTTLLAQVDASVGGKVGVNHRLGKNMIGAFHQPRLVLIDPETLATLPPRELVSGFAEMVKHALILDRAYFDSLQEHFAELAAVPPQVLGEAILRSCTLKAAVVSSDERETGRRALLNFGHTIGHALEAAAGFGNLRHGEAVLVGMLAEAYLSCRAGWLADEEYGRIHNFLCRIPLSLAIGGITMKAIEEFLYRDKKTRGGVPRMVLLRAIGLAEITKDWPRDLLPQAVDHALRAFARPGA